MGKHSLVECRPGPHSQNDAFYPLGVEYVAVASSIVDSKQLPGLTWPALLGPLNHSCIPGYGESIVVDRSCDLHRSAVSGSNRLYLVGDLFGEAKRTFRIQTANFALEGDLFARCSLPCRRK